MRLSTAYNYQTSVSLLESRQSQLNEAQERMSTGKRVSKPSDDPAALARSERALSEQMQSETRLRAIDASRNAMTLTESALGSAIDLTQSVRETLVSAGNGGYSTSERTMLVAELRGLRAQLLAAANQSDGNGGYLFGGQGMKTAPFADTAAGVVSQVPDQDSAYQAATEENLPLSVNGREVWLSAGSGNGSFVTAPGKPNQGTSWITAGNVTDPSALDGRSYQVEFAVDAAGSTTYSIYQLGKDAAGNSTRTLARDSSGAALSGLSYGSGHAITEVPGMSFAVTGKPSSGDVFSVEPSSATGSVFDAIDAAIDTLGNAQATSMQAIQAVQSGLRDVDQALGRMQSVRAVVGETLNRLDSLQNRADARVLSAKTTRSNAEDVDMVEAVSAFTNKQSSYQAALQSYAMVQKLSLFQYINN